MSKLRIQLGSKRPQLRGRKPSTVRVGTRAGLSSYVSFWPNGMAKTGTLPTLINQCLKLSLIVSFLYGTALLKRLEELVAPLPTTLNRLVSAQALKAYPSSPMVLPDLDESFLMESVKDTSLKTKSKQPVSGRK